MSNFVPILFVFDEGSSFYSCVSSALLAMWTYFQWTITPIGTSFPHDIGTTD
jgi:hypothetical protein